MNPQLERLEQAIVDIENAVHTATDALSAGQMVWTPKTDAWSIAQILDHLNATSRALLPELAKGVEMLRGRGDRSDGPFPLSGPERLFLWVVSPGTPIRVPVPPGYAPRADAEELKNVRAEFASEQEGMRRLLRAADGWNLNGTAIPSPVNRRVKLRLAAWLEATVAHERYHLLQVQALCADARLPGRQ